jgi:hypothetical protein|uniref:DH domain-containing protein n=1 Tax=Castor canadensis TaxID=51338 RepID=A0A8C0WKK5_CASCN
MEAPSSSGGDPSGDIAADGAHPDPPAPGAAAPSSGPCAAARESERQLRLRLCVLNEILGTERDYVGTLRFLQSVSVAGGAGTASARPATCGRGPGGSRCLGGAPSGHRHPDSFRARGRPDSLRGSPHPPAPARCPFVFFSRLPAFQIVLKLVTSARQGLRDPGVRSFSWDNFSSRSPPATGVGQT